MRRSQILLKNLPVQGTNRVTPVNGKNGKNQQEWIGVTDGSEQFCAAEIAEMQHPARTVDDKPQHQQSDQDDNKLPRRCLHALASVARAATCVKARDAG